ncbi:MAG: hypothetical protein AAFZ63_25235 [Bacteroidota bacterium]
MEDYDPKDFLLFALNHFGLEVNHNEGKMVYLKQGYTIEIEGKELFKLSYQDEVVAPFGSVEELCHFIQSDIKLHEEA